MPTIAALVAFFLGLALALPAQGSALNVIQRDDAIYFFSDAASFDENLVVQEFGPKIYIIPAARAAMGSIGDSAIGDFVSASIVGSVSLEEAISGAEKALKFITRRTIQDATGHSIVSNLAEQKYLMIIGGLSSAGIGQVWSVRARLGDADPRFKMLSSNSRTYSPYDFSPLSIGKGAAEVLTREMQPNSIIGDMERHMRLVVEAQRHTIFRNPELANGARVHVAGGFLQSTKITLDTITTRILVRWPDNVGQRIDPQPYELGD